MRLCAVILASLVMTAFAPEQGQNKLECRVTDPDGQTQLTLQSVFTRIDDLFLVVAPVQIDGHLGAQEIHRTFTASQFKFDMQLDSGNERRLTLHTRSGVNARIKWVLREDPGTDGILMEWPAELGVTPVKADLALKAPRAVTDGPGPRASCSATRFDP